MSPQPIASGAGHGAAMSSPQSGIEKIHGSDYGLLRELGGPDVTGTASEEWWMVLRLIGGEYLPARRFAVKADAMDYVTTMVRALKARGRK